MKCENCNKSNNRGQKYCNYCGMKLTPEVTKYSVRSRVLFCIGGVVYVSALSLAICLLVTI